MSAFSAPGKALLAGGYLVLEQLRAAYVTALSARMHAVIEERDSSSDAKDTIIVESPQFNGNWSYEIHDGLHVVGDDNPFLKSTIKTVAAYYKKTGYHLHITIWSDPGFHTEKDTEARTLKGGKTFLFHKAAIGDVPKTGLGLSAGLVTVVTGALVSYFEKVDISTLKNKIHNLAQIAHCDAQGKIGSGFDVAAAIYGSIVYLRFSESIIKPVFEDWSLIKNIVDQEWRFLRLPQEIPDGLTLLIGDVSGGSETPKLVSKVNDWRKGSPATSGILFEELNAANESFIRALGVWRFFNDSRRVKEAVRSIRRQFQLITQALGAAVEPKEQTELLDACMAIRGCIGAVVPGAGGYDAICVLVEDKLLPYFFRDAKAEIFERVTWLKLQPNAEGFKQEDPALYEF